MAVDLFVTPTGGLAHDGSNEANAFSTAEMITHWLTGDVDTVYWIKTGAHTMNTASIPQVGATRQRVYFRGYHTNPEDLDGANFGSNTSLTIADHPTITLSQTWNLSTASAYAGFRNLHLTGAVNDTLLGNTSVDNVDLENCCLNNTANHSSARCFESDNYLKMLFCDIRCTGDAHASPVFGDSPYLVIGNKFTTTDATAACYSGRPCLLFAFNTFDSAGGDCLYFDHHTTNVTLIHNTFFGNGGSGTAVRFNSSSGIEEMIYLINNHVSDTEHWIDNPSVTTREFNDQGTRYRDITGTLREGNWNGVVANEVADDDGDHSTDFTDAINGDLSLALEAAARLAGVRGADVGAWQAALAGGSSSFLRGDMQGGFDA